MQHPSRGPPPLGGPWEPPGFSNGQSTTEYSFYPPHYESTSHPTANLASSAASYSGSRTTSRAASYGRGQESSRESDSYPWETQSWRWEGPHGQPPESPPKPGYIVSQARRRADNSTAADIRRQQRPWQTESPKDLPRRRSSAAQEFLRQQRQHQQQKQQPQQQRGKYMASTYTGKAGISASAAAKHAQKAAALNSSLEEVQRTLQRAIQKCSLKHQQQQPQQHEQPRPQEQHVGPLPPAAASRSEADVRHDEVYRQLLNHGGKHGGIAPLTKSSPQHHPQQPQSLMIEGTFTATCSASPASSVPQTPASICHSAAAAAPCLPKEAAERPADISGYPTAQQQQEKEQHAVKQQIQQQEQPQQQQPPISEVAATPLSSGSQKLAVELLRRQMLQQDQRRQLQPQHLQEEQQRRQLMQHQQQRMHELGQQAEKRQLATSVPPRFLGPAGLVLSERQSVLQHQQERQPQKQQQLLFQQQELQQPQRYFQRQQQHQQPLPQYTISLCPLQQHSSSSNELNRSSFDAQAYLLRVYLLDSCHRLETLRRSILAELARDAFSFWFLQTKQPQLKALWDKKVLRETCQLRRLEQKAEEAQQNLCAYAAQRQHGACASKAQVDSRVGLPTSSGLASEVVEDMQRQVLHQANRLRIYKIRRGAALGGVILQQLLRRLAVKQQQDTMMRLRNGGPSETQLLNLAVQMLPK
ncbi:mediator of RNA polymerase II transcription subunit 15-like [Cyclospora cayetanensis]|uniref:Mediator of RNA polymerase II transcription subunit 15-like n=1 Tax=Cyclospora cayetanensis TaxID=88456 RepID=A0A6P6RXE9_9EIME|nr:mediator of RNA polymerase II transcription subunit 15-like [Cyclospora cayetanensis]